MIFQNIENAVAKIAGEHRLISDYVERFASAHENRDKAFFKELGGFMALMQRDLADHFSLEERVIFPAAVNGLKDHDITLMVLNLQKEHGSLETRLSEIMENRYAIVSGRMENPIIETIADFLRDLGGHAKIEMHDLFPAMDKNIRCKTLMQRFLTLFSENEKKEKDGGPGLKSAPAADGKKKVNDDFAANLNDYTTVVHLSGEHELIAKNVTRFERALREEDKDFFAELSIFMESLETWLHRHFITEELSFFPAALNGILDYEMTMTVLNLQKEHGVFETEIESMRKNRHAILGAAGYIKNPLIERISLFLRALKAHAILEMNYVFPAIARDDACRNLLVKYLKDMKSGA